MTYKAMNSSITPPPSITFIAPATAALAQPEPQGPTDEEVYDLADVFNGDPVPAIRRALELWGRPAIEPVPQEPTFIEVMQLADDFFTFRGNSHGGAFFATEITAKTDPGQALEQFARAVLARWGCQ